MRARMKRLSVLAFAATLLTTGGAQGMDRAGLVEKIASETQLEESEARFAVDAFVATTTSALKRGDRVALSGFGQFTIARRQAHGSCVVEAFPEFEFDPEAAGCDTPECHACTTYDADIAEGMAIAARLDPRLASVILNIIKREITKELFVANQIVHIDGLGRFRVVLESEISRSSSNPPRKKELAVVSRKVVRFTPGDDLVTSVR